MHEIVHSSYEAHIPRGGTIVAVIGSCRRPNELQALPPRTNKSDLSDDELLLFDMMFDGNASASQLSSNVYSLHLNCLYSHSLDDAELHETLNSLLSRKLIVPIGDPLKSNETRYALTEKGGRMWELERKPDWQRYVSTLQKELGMFPTGSITVFCLNRDTGRKCLGAMFAAGMITPGGPIRTRSTFDKRLMPWKNFSHVHVLRCRTLDNVRSSPRPIEWDVYELTRSWWRSIGELIALRQ